MIWHFIDRAEDYFILGYEVVRSITLPLRGWVFSHFPGLDLTAIGKMLMARFRLSLPSATSWLVRDARKPEHDSDASDNPGRLRKVALCEKALPPTAST